MLDRTPSRYLPLHERISRLASIVIDICCCALAICGACGIALCAYFVVRVLVSG